MEFIELGFFGIFLSTFIAATLIPMPSELIVVVAINYGYDPYLVVGIATLGNSLGSLTNYYIGFYSRSEKLIKKFKINQTKLDYWTIKSKKYGYWLGLLAWVPFIGDPLMAIVGFLKVNIKALMVTITFGKLVRYIIITIAYIYWK